MRSRRFVRGLQLDDMLGRNLGLPWPWLHRRLLALRARRCPLVAPAQVTWYGFKEQLVHFSAGAWRTELPHTRHSYEPSYGSNFGAIAARRTPPPWRVFGEEKKRQWTKEEKYVKIKCFKLYWST